MARNLSGRTIVITGGASGLGLHYTKHLLSLGARVAVLDSRPFESFETDVGSSTNLLCTECDVSDWQSVKSSFDKIVQKLLTIDVLINNASTYSSSVRRSFEHIESEQWKRTFDVNVLGSFHCIKACFEHLKNNGGGRIINISSDACLKGLPHLLDYVTSKGALISMTRALANELGPYGITVNAVAPGYVRHPDSAWNEERDAFVRDRRCLKRTEEPDDLAGVIAFLCSDDSKFITGQTIVVDGGEVFV